jgi:hypothetical protein
VVSSLETAFEKTIVEGKHILTRADLCQNIGGVLSWLTTGLKGCYRQDPPAQNGVHSRQLPLAHNPT